MRLKGMSCTNGYIEIVSGITSSARCEVAASRHTCVSFCWSGGGGGVLEGAVEHESGRSAEAAQDMGKDVEQGAGDGQVLVCLAACIVRGVGFEG